MNNLIETQIPLSASEQRMFETHASAFSYEEARLSCTALIRRVTAEREYFEEASQFAATGWYRRGTLRRYEKRLHAIQRFAERLPVEPVEWDDMSLCYEINIANEGL